MVAREAVTRGAGGIDDLVADFARFLIREDRSPATVRTYEWALRDFTAYLASAGIATLAMLTRRFLEAWQDRLVAAGMKARSRSLAASAVRQFLKWAADHEYCDARLTNWLAQVKVRPLRPKPLEADQLEALKLEFGQRPKGGRDVLQRLRNRALFFYLLTTGARVSEALQVPRNEFARHYVRQKGGTEKLLVCPDSVQLIVRDYLAERRDKAPYLFVTHPGNRPLTPTAVRAIWVQTTHRLGLPHFTTHALRHTFATELLEKGIDPVTVAELLGHHGMGTIRNYAKVGEAARQRALAAIEQVVQTPPDPRVLPRLKRSRGRPKLRVVPKRDSTY